MSSISPQIKLSPTKLKEKNSIRILGIDPGYGRMGYGIIEDKNGKLQAIDYGCVETLKSDDRASRLCELRDKCSRLIADAKPDIAGIETLFFSKNVKTALAVGEARGVLLLTLADHALPISELSPQEVKMAVTGYGKAEKGQVQKMVAKILGLSKIPKPDDAADALALAIAVAQMRKFLMKM